MNKLIAMHKAMAKKLGVIMLVDGNLVHWNQSIRVKYNKVNNHQLEC
jgi:hypothetical protein